MPHGRNGWRTRRTRVRLFAVLGGDGVAGAGA